MGHCLEMNREMIWHGGQVSVFSNCRSFFSCGTCQNSFQKPIYVIFILYHISNCLGLDGSATLPLLLSLSLACRLNSSHDALRCAIPRAFTIQRGGCSGVTLKANSVVDTGEANPVPSIP